MIEERDPTDLDDLENIGVAKAKKQQAEATAEDADLRWLMANKRGRRVAWRQLSQAGVFRLSFSTNAMQMSFNEGQRDQGLKMLARIMEVCPDLYFEMTRENTK